MVDRVNYVRSMWSVHHVFVFQITPMVHFIVILFNDDDDNVIVITLEVIFTITSFEIKINSVIS